MLPLERLFPTSAVIAIVLMIIFICWRIIQLWKQKKRGERRAVSDEPTRRKGISPVV